MVGFGNSGWGITSWGDDHYLPQHQGVGFSCLIVITPMDLKI